MRARRDQQVPAPARQADAAPARHLVHTAKRHLADGLARERAAELHPLPARDAAVRRAPGGDHRRGRGAVHDRSGGKALHVPGGCAGARAGAVIPPLVAGAPDALPLQRDARRRHGLQLLCHAQVQRRDGCERRAPPVSQRQAVFSQRPARSGLLAGRALHRAERRRARLRHPAGQGHGLQHAAQAHQGRARPLVLSLRPAGHARLAGHALRRQTLRPAHRLHPARDGLAPRRQLVSPLRPHERDGAQGVFERAARHGHHALQPPVHRRVGAVQRGLGPV